MDASVPFTGPGPGFSARHSRGCRSHADQEGQWCVCLWCYGVVAGLAIRVEVRLVLWPARRTVRVTLSPTVSSCTWAPRDRDPSMELPSTAMIASPTCSPALSAGVPATTLVSTAAARLADPAATTPALA